jgi:hypothetical protein
MTFTAWIDVAVGLSVLYMGAALFVTIVNEYIAQAFKLRGKELTRNLATLLDAAGLEQLVKENRAFQPLLDATKQVRSYVDPNVMAQVLVGCLRESAHGSSTPSLVHLVNRLPESTVKSVLWTLAQSAKNDVDTFVKGVSVWVDRSLTVLGEGYKQRMQKITFGLGFAIAVIFNINTLSVATRLYSDKELREQLSIAAEQYIQKVSPEVLDRCGKLDPKARDKSTECEPIQRMATAVVQRGGTFAKLSIGWESWSEFWTEVLPNRVDPGKWAARWCGWFLTALAISLGAPFWFDTLNRVVNVRHSIRRPTVQQEDEK